MNYVPHGSRRDMIYFFQFAAFHLCEFTLISSFFFSSHYLCVGFHSCEVHTEGVSAPWTLEPAWWHQHLYNGSWQGSNLCLRGCQVIFCMWHLPDLVSQWGKDQVLRMEGFLNVTLLHFFFLEHGLQVLKSSTKLYLIQNNSHCNIHIVT